MLVVTGVSSLIHLYSVAYMDSDAGLPALLRLPELLRLLDAGAGPGRQLRAADRRLGVRRRGVVPADLVLVPPRDRHERRHQGVRHQRDRRRRARDRRVPAAARTPATLDYVGVVRGGSERLHDQRRHAGRRLPAAPRRRVREVRADPAAHLAAGRDGGPDAGLRADPRGDDGHRRRLPDRAHAPAVRARADGRRRRRDHRPADADHGRDDRAGRHRPEARDRLLDDLADRLHDRRRRDVRARRRPVPPDDARVLQGAAVHGRRVGDLRDGRRRRAVDRPDGRLPQGDAVHVHHVH